MNNISDFNSILLNLSKPDGTRINIRLVPYYLYSWILKKIENFNPELSEKLHEKEKPLISIGKIKILDQKSLFIRVNVLQKELARFIIEILKKTENINLNTQKLKLKDFSFGSSNIERIDISESFDDIHTLYQDKTHILYEFNSTTFFKRNRRNYIFPDPALLYKDLAKKFSSYANVKIDVDKVTQKSNYINVSDMEIKTSVIKFKGVNQIGFTGSVKYDLSDIKDEYREFFFVLSRFGFYSGIGYKTNLGFGENIPVFE